MHVQVGDTKKFENTEADGKACWRYWASFRSTLPYWDCVFVVFKVGDCMSAWPVQQVDLFKDELDFLTKVGVQSDPAAPATEKTGDFQAGSSWAAICHGGGVAAMRSPATKRGTRKSADKDGKPVQVRLMEPDDMVLTQAMLNY